MGKLFGTDGIRGVANDGLDIDLALKVGKAAAVILAKGEGRKPVIAIGKDTRLSCDMLESALVAGICAAGADVMVLGVVPTPAVAFITKEAGADAGIVISASHNSYEDNGIKIFNNQGFKLSDELEAEIERLVLPDVQIPIKTHARIGRVIRKNKDFVEKYIDHLEAAAEHEIRGLKVLIDCSNGAAGRTASDLFSRFDIDLDIVKDHPNGLNINENCGSTHMDALRATVVSAGYDIGIAFDGDADRCLIVDEKGDLVDGDKIMGVCGRAMLEAGKLSKATIVATVMSNMGFHAYAEGLGIDLVCTAVGDRNVLEKMLESGYNLGGEQSGHMIFLDHATTGDGQLAAVKFLALLAASGKTVSALAGEIPSYPQVLLNIPIAGGNEEKNRIMASGQLAAAIRDEEARLGGGRILVRPSGTEPLIRVLAEAADGEAAERTAKRLGDLIKTLYNL